MTYDIKLNSAHDLALQRLDLVLIDGAARVRQQIEVTLLAFLGEWFLDTTFGVPYFEKILVKTPVRSEIENIIRAKVKDVPGVSAVPSVVIETEAGTRRARITVAGIQHDDLDEPIDVQVIR